MFSDLSSYASKVKKILDKKSEKEATLLLEDLESFAEEVTMGAENYYDIVKRFNYIKTNQQYRMRRDERELAEELSRVDGSRRSVHNSLIISLRGLARVVRKIQEGFGVKIKPPKIFPEAELSLEQTDRVDVGVWAQQAALVQKLDGYIKKVREKLGVQDEEGVKGKAA